MVLWLPVRSKRVLDFIGFIFFGRGGWELDYPLQYADGIEAGNAFVSSNCRKWLKYIVMP